MLSVFCYLFGLEMAESTRKRGKPSLLKENADPAADGEDSGKKCLRLSLPKKSKPVPRELFSFVSSEEVEAAKKAIVPKNTKKCTDWSVRTFRSWLTQRNERCASGDECQFTIISEQNVLRAFVATSTALVSLG